MNKVSDKLTVYFEEPFWVGVFEKVEGKKLSVSKVTFGTEPKDYEVYEFLLKHYYDLQFSPSVTTVIKEVKQNPKRRQREVKKQLRNTGIGTKSQQALNVSGRKPSNYTGSSYVAPKTGDEGIDIRFAGAFALVFAGISLLVFGRKNKLVEE